MQEYKKRYEGIRWQIVYGSYQGVERFAVNQLQKCVQRFMPYVVEVVDVQDDTAFNDNLILIGTTNNNPLIKQIIDAGAIPAPEGPEGYSIACTRFPQLTEQRVIVIAGSDANGVLYGVNDFDARVLRSMICPPEMRDMKKAFDTMPDFQISEKPMIANRGIWTWGYVIYDYKRFIDNMARCKMNMLTVWNDCVPLNCDNVIEYAHSRGVKVVLGFHWGWGIDTLDLTDMKQRQELKADILKNYRENYAHLGMDGIYFQTVTEHTNTKMGNKSTAALVCDWVNDVARDILHDSPGLQIQFGLHATSIQEDYTDLSDLDPRIIITWEDAGVMPYSYDPLPYQSSYLPTRPERLNTLDATIEYSKRLATFRKDSGFAMVPKGLVNLSWEKEFEHHGPFILGERNPAFIKKRLMEAQPRWDYVNSHWLEHYPSVTRFFREVLSVSPDNFTATVLIEDGMFEEKIQPSAALVSEILWNPYRDERQLLQLALNSHYD